MLLTIRAPHLAQRLQHLAQTCGSTPDAVAEHLLEVSLLKLEESSSEIGLPQSEGVAESTARGATLPSSLSPAERKERFHHWLTGVQELNLPQLPPEAFERASFYEDERHLAANPF